jgi:DeoR/GlpR family transcriptional regulator of sugar metabolism
MIYVSSTMRRLHIRCDLQQLEEQGLFGRTHGGAVSDRTSILGTISEGRVFIGANGIDPSAGVTCHSSDEAAVNLVMISQAKRRIAVLDEASLALSPVGRSVLWKSAI